MTHTTTTPGNVSPRPLLVMRRNTARSILLAATLIALAVAAITSIMAAMVATSMMVASFTTSPNIHAEDPAARAIILTSSRDTPRRLADQVRTTQMIADAGSASNDLTGSIDPPTAPKPADVANSMPPIAMLMEDSATIEPKPPARPAESASLPAILIPNKTSGPVLAYADPSLGDDTPSVATTSPAPAPETTPSTPPASDASADLSDSILAVPEQEPADNTGSIPLPPVRSPDVTQSIPLPPASPPRHASGQILASIRPDDSNIDNRPTRAPAITLPEGGYRTAYYDIAAHTVYLPNGERLEAHSGLGNRLDDPRSVSEKNRGATPPNTYELKLREQRFHGVAALRLTPVGGGGVYGRTGLLAHTYMLGPRGDSNGCVSFRDYSRFLRAFTSGEVTRLVVVPHLSGTPIASSPRKRSSWFAFNDT